MKKEKKLNKKEWHLKFLKDELEHKKRVYGTYIEVLVKYHISEIAYSSIMAQEYLDNCIKRKLDMSFGKPGDARKWLFGFGNKLSVVERIERDIEHYNHLIKLAEVRIRDFDQETKVKIAKDAIEKQNAWLRFDIPNISKPEKKKLTYRQDLCKCGEIKTKKAKNCRKCYGDKNTKKRGGTKK